MLNKMKLLRVFRVPKDSFGAHVLTLTTGTTIAQGIPLFIAPVLTRIYTPEDFGIIALYMAIASIIAVISTGRYELAGMLPDKNEDAMNIFALSVVLVLFVSLTTLLIVWFFNDHIAHLLNKPEISYWLYYIPLTIFLAGIYQTLNYWSNRKKQYKRLAMSKIAHSSTTAGTHLGLGFSGFGASGLILGNIVGQSIGTGYLGAKVLREERGLRQKISLRKMKKLCIEYLDYPKKSAVGALLNAASYQVEFILFSVFYNLTNLGHYYFVNRIVSIPKVFISGSVWQVFLGENSRKSKTEILSSLSHYQQKMFIMTTLPFYSSLFIAPDLFIVIFGENWSVGGAYLYPLIIASHINLVVASFSLFTIINRPDIEMAFNALLAFFKIAAVIVTYLIVNNIFYSVVAVAAVQFIMFLMLGGWNYRQLGKSNSYFPLLYCKQLINIAPKLIILFVVSYLTQSFPLMLAAVIVLNSIHLKSELL